MGYFEKRSKINALNPIYPIYPTPLCALFCIRCTPPERLKELVKHECLDGMKLEFVVSLSSTCNLSCSHCYLDKKSPAQLSTHDLERTANDFHPYKVNFFGGEPLLYGSLERAFEIFSGTPITISTNGILLPQRIKLVEKAEAVLCSVEGLEQTTDSIRGRGVWKRVMKGVDLLKERGIKTILRCSYSRDNLKELPKLASLAQKLEVGLMLFPRLDKFPLDIEGQLYLFELATKHDGVWVDQVNYWTWLGKDSYCPAGDRRLAISCDGEIVPCQWSEYYLGKLGDDSSIVHENAKTFVQAFKHPVEECYRCPSMATCKSGCLFSKAYLGCPLAYNAGEKMTALNSFGYNVVRGKVDSIRGLLKGVVVC